jgi:ribosomal-protein-alanine N-acetyltransferase
MSHMELSLAIPSHGTTAPAGVDANATGTEWRQALPVLTAPGVTLRNLRIEDAASLFEYLTAEEVARFISPPPANVEAFGRFIRWALERQRAGKYACFAIVPTGSDHAVGIIQLRDLSDDFRLAEWGFAIGFRYWGTGLFAAAAELVLSFAFGVVGIERLEARCVIENARGVGALRKLHAVPERLLPNGLVLGDHVFDQVLWTITRIGHQSRARLRSTSRPAVH